MSEKSDNFEQMISRIHELLEGENAEVIWNEHIPDPDNLEQQRQIDVLIKNDNFLTIIECRLHKQKQNVKWVEELIGRKLSLNADCIIGVSSTGFTKGAIKKANKYGIILKDINNLSDEEIRSWSRSINMSIFFYHYLSFEIIFNFNNEDLENINYEKLKHDLCNYHGLMSIFTAPNESIDSQKLILQENRNKKLNFAIKFLIEDFYLDQKRVNHIEVHGRVCLEEVKIGVPEVLAYGDSDLDHQFRNTIIQKYNLGDTNIVHHNGAISICLDLSKLDIPPYWQFRFFEVTSDHENNHNKLEIIGLDKIIMKIDKYNLTIVGQ